MADFPLLQSALRSFLSDLRPRDGDPDTQWNDRREHRGEGVGFDRDARGPGGPEFGDGDVPVDGRWNQDDGDGPDLSRLGDDRGRGPDASRQPGGGALPRPGDAPARGDVPPPASALGSGIDALVRELRELPSELVRQTGPWAESNPAGLQRSSANPGTLAELMAQSQQDARDVRQGAGTEGRLLATATGDALLATDGRPEGRLPADARFGAQPLPGAGEVHVGVEAGGTTALQAQQLAAMLARADMSPATGDPLSHARPDTTSAGAAAAAGSTMAADPSQVPPARAPGEAMAMQARAEGSVVAGDRGGLSGLPGNAAALAGGVTLAAVANPAGTTYAIAPQAPSWPRAAPKAKDGEHDDGADEGDEPDAGRDDRRQRRDGKAAAPGNPAGPHTGALAADARPAGHAGQGATPGRRVSPPAGGGWLAAMLGLAPQVRGNPGAAPSVTEQQRESRRLPVLYWALIAAAYGCLGLSLATVAPEFFKLPIADEHLATWRNGLTAAGLVSGFWAWLLARRMR